MIENTKNKLTIPEQVLIEPVNGMCTSRCTMCSFPTWTRKPNVLNMDDYEKILSSLKPYKEDIKMLTLFGVGEPLLDEEIVKKVSIANKEGFSGLGFASNCTELSDGCSRDLIEAGLNTLIASIDGIKKETHEKIRIRTNFDIIVKNVENYIKIRNELKATDSRILIRFVRQEANRDEWPDFHNHWSKKINKDYGDKVIKVDVHNWGNNVDKYDSKDVNTKIDIHKFICPEIFNKLLIRTKGEISLCDADDNVFFDLGNALKEDPIKAWNKGKFAEYRKAMKKGKMSELEHCKTCSIPRSLILKLDQEEDCCY